MKNERSSKWIYSVVSTLVAVALVGFAYSVRPDTAALAAKKPEQPWGILSKFSIGSNARTEKQFVHGADSIHTASLHGQDQQTVQACWNKGEHVVTLVFIKGRLSSSYELWLVRDAQGRISERKWQAMSRGQRWAESGQL